MLTTSQFILFAILLLLFALLAWGRWRYDVVAFAALVAALIAGVVPIDQAAQAAERKAIQEEIEREARTPSETFELP